MYNPASLIQADKPKVLRSVDMRHAIIRTLEYVRRGNAMHVRVLCIPFQSRFRIGIVLAVVAYRTSCESDRGRIFRER